MWGLFPVASAQHFEKHMTPITSAAPSTDRGARAPAPAHLKAAEQAIARSSQSAGAGQAGWVQNTTHRHVSPEVFRVADTLVACGVFLLAFVLTNLDGLPRGGLESFLAMRVTMKNLLLVTGFIVLWQVIFTALGLYSGRRVASWTDEFLAVGIAVTLAGAAAAIVPIAGLSGAFGFAAVFVFWVVAAFATLAERAALRSLATRSLRISRLRQVIIVGSGPRAYAAYRTVRDHPETGYQVVGFVDSNPNIESPEIRAMHLGTLDEFESLLMHRNIDTVLITLPTKSRYDEIQEAIRVCERVGVESQYLADIFQRSLARQSYEQAGPMPAVTMKVVHDDVRLLVKRTFDMMAASLGLIVLSPVLLAIAIAIRLTSPGPIFFAQERYGLNRRIFRMYKFRTMHCNAEALQYTVEHLNEASGPVFKIKNDPRVTPLGRLLRRTSLDELPQLFNVIKGDMSLVGPRPLPLRDVGHFSAAWLMRRFSVLPGLTCLWQISGRSNLGFDDWVTLDLQYIDGWSLRMDVKILLKTIPAVIRGVGAS
jgi:exopolysaccharide biosynthesis polyprenyl glycosylphosphotransferase